MKGKIIKGIAGFYYVRTETGVYECKAKGIFRKENQKPLVGDNVQMSVLDEAEREGNIEQILPRQNELIRPAAANIDQALVIFAAAEPKPNLHLLDRFLVAMERQAVRSVICFNKADLVSEEQRAQLLDIYRNCGCAVVFSSARTGQGTDRIRELLQGKTTAVAGPSGVGKSSLVNLLARDARMQTGEISRKIDRGRHTTRHAELFSVDPDTFLMDTPGFSALAVWDMEKEELKDYFPEFRPYDGCRFLGCTHTHEPDCAVKDALAAGLISEQRYQHYLEMYEELKNRKKY